MATWMHQQYELKLALSHGVAKNYFSANDFKATNALLLYSVIFFTYILLFNIRSQNIPKMITYILQLILNSFQGFPTSNFGSVYLLCSWCQWRESERLSSLRRLLSPLERDLELPLDEEFEDHERALPLSSRLLLFLSWDLDLWRSK